MIYILVGNDTKNKNIFLRELISKDEVFFVPSNTSDKSLVLGYSSNINLFGKNPIIILDNILNEGNLIFSDEDFVSLKNSETTFIFKEEKMSALDQKKYKKFGDIKIFESKNIVSNIKFNVFNIADAFAKRDKINTWILYQEAIANNVEPEAIAGVLFWKIKNMILSGSRVFSLDELKTQSSIIISLYHKAHRGELDFVISLEQFILSSLSSK